MSLLEFLDEEDKYTPSLVERERRRRIILAVAAYAYEYDNNIIIPDASFDQMSKEVDKGADTGRPILDKFFREEFEPDTGMWIHKHPEKDKVKKTYEKWFKKGK